MSHLWSAPSGPWGLRASEASGTENATPCLGPPGFYVYSLLLAAYVGTLEITDILINWLFSVIIIMVWPLAQFSTFLSHRSRDFRGNYILVVFFFFKLLCFFIPSSKVWCCRPGVALFACWGRRETLGRASLGANVFTERALGFLGTTQEEAKGFSR